MSDASKRFEEAQKRFQDARNFFSSDDLVMVEEAAAEVARRMPKPKLHEREVVTRTLDRQSEAVAYTYDLVSSKTMGHLRELSIRSPSTNFSLLIVTDGVNRLSRTYTELTTLATISELVDAFPELDDNGAATGNYVVRIEELRWTTDCLISIHIEQPSQSITFLNLFAVFNEYLS